MAATALQPRPGRGAVRGFLEREGVLFANWKELTARYGKLSPPEQAPQAEAASQ